MKELITALIQAQGEFPHIVKDAKNPHFGNAYASLEQVISLTGPALRKNGLVIVQTFGVDMTLTTTLYHVSGESISGTQTLLFAKQDAQGLAGASTYARRYGLLSILGIASEDDDGESAVKNPNPMSENEINYLLNVIETTETLQELKTEFIFCYKKAADIGDKNAQEIFSKAKDKRKNELELPNECKRI